VKILVINCGSSSIKYRVYAMPEKRLLGISGVSSDMRDVVEAADHGSDRAQLALDVFSYRVRKYIGAYMAVLGELHALTFSGGIGENDPDLRRRACENLERFGIEIDPEKNAADEELAIANDVYDWLTI
jgi:acetate kinase